jgi:signal transduction histidine kinase
MIMIASLHKSHSSLGLLDLVQIAVEGLSPSRNTRCTEPADQIFDAFFTTKPQGTDIGLTNSRSRIACRLWGTSNSGRGTCFQFVLPDTALSREVVRR